MTKLSHQPSERYHEPLDQKYCHEIISFRDYVSNFKYHIFPLMVTDCVAKLLLPSFLGCRKSHLFPSSGLFSDHAQQNGLARINPTEEMTNEQIRARKETKEVGNKHL